MLILRRFMLILRRKSISYSLIAIFSISFLSISHKVDAAPEYCSDQIINLDNFSFTPIYDYLLSNVDRMLLEGKFSEGLTLAQQLYGHSNSCYGKDDLTVGVALYWLGYYHLNLQNEENVRELLIRSAEFIKRSKTFQGVDLDGQFEMRPWDSADQFRKVALHRTLNLLAGFLSSQGNSKDAITIYERLLNQDKAILKKTPQKLVAVLVNLAQANNALEQRKEAIKHLRMAINITKKHSLDEWLMAVNNLTLGNLHSLEGDYKLAMQAYNEAEGISKRIYGKEHIVYAAVLKAIGTTQIGLNKLHMGVENLKQALKIQESLLGKNARNLIDTLVAIAAAMQKQKKYPQAYKLLKRALKIEIRYQNLQLQSKEITNQFMLDKTNTKRKKIFELYLKIMHQLDANNQAKNSFLPAQRTAHSHASIALNKLTDRFSLKYELRKYLRQKQDLEFEWRKIQKSLLDQLKENDKSNVIGKRLLSVEKRIIDINKKIRHGSPKFFNLSNPKPLSIDDVQKFLGDDEALIYFVDTNKWETIPEETFIWVVTKNNFKWVTSYMGSKSLDKAVKTLRCSVDPRARKLGKVQDECHTLWGDDILGGLSGQFTHQEAHKLYRALFGKIEHIIKKKSLIIIPSGALTQLPFQVLITQKYKSNEPVQWMAQSHDITILPAVSSLSLRNFSKQKVASEPIIGFGNPLLNGTPGEDDKRAADARKFQKCPVPYQIASSTKGGKTKKAQMQGLLADPQELKKETPLPETAYELCSVAKSLGGSRNSIYLGDMATESKVKTLSKTGHLGKYRIVHFSTHGFFAGQISGPNEPGLVLTPPEKATKLDDGYLTASEVANLKLNADWVILSACNTASGDAENAEALSGLARAFFYAQARSLLVSHWEVEIDATTHLISTMVQHKDSGRAKALQKAMMSMINSNKWKHPKYWAPFILVGEGK